MGRYWKFFQSDPFNAFYSPPPPLSMTKNTYWNAGEWQCIKEGKPEPGKNGFHAYERISDAAKYGSSNVVGLVTGAGAFATDGTQFAFESMLVRGLWKMKDFVLRDFVEHFVGYFFPDFQLPAETTNKIILRSIAETAPLLPSPYKHAEFVDEIYWKLRYKNCWDIIGEVALLPHDPMPGDISPAVFVDLFFLNNIICESPTVRDPFYDLPV